MKTIYKLDEITEENLGCWIDGTDLSGLFFDFDVVETAIHFGWDINVEDWKELKAQAVTYDEAVLEDMAYVADSALRWLESQLPEGYYFEIDANCLFLTHEDMELIND